MYEFGVWLEARMTGDEGQIEGSRQINENSPVVGIGEASYIRELLSARVQ